MRGLLLALLLASPAAAHSWYDGACCSEHDCRQTVLGEVERRADGWFVKPLTVTVPFGDSRLRKSQDPLIHVCIAPGAILNGKRGPAVLRCLYLPDPGS